VQIHGVGFANNSVGRLLQEPASEKSNGNHDDVRYSTIDMSASVVVLLSHTWPDRELLSRYLVPFRGVFYSVPTVPGCADDELDSQ
jgi:hypothetical protein